MEGNGLQRKSSANVKVVGNVAVAEDQPAPVLVDVPVAGLNNDAIESICMDSEYKLATFLINENSLADKLFFIRDLHFKLYYCADPAYKLFINMRGENECSLVLNLFYGLPHIIGDKFKEKYCRIFNILLLANEEEIAGTK